MDRAAEHVVGTMAHRLAQAPRNLARGAVGERHRADPRGGNALHIHEVADPLDEAEGLARARPGQHQDRPCRCFNGGALGWAGSEGHAGKLAPTCDIHWRIVSHSSSRTCASVRPERLSTWNE